MKIYEVMELKRKYHELMKLKWIGGFIAGCLSTAVVYSIALHVIMVV